MGEDVRGLKEKVGEIANDLIKESTKREQENKVLGERFASLDEQLKSLDNKSIKNEVKLDTVKEEMLNIQRGVERIDNNVEKLSNKMIAYNTESNINVRIKTIVITGFVTFIITILAGVILWRIQSL